MEENSSLVTYTGVWTTGNDPGASGGTYTSSSQAGSTASFTFTGDTLTV